MWNNNRTHWITALEVFLCFVVKMITGSERYLNMVTFRNKVKKILYSEVHHVGILLGFRNLKSSGFGAFTSYKQPGTTTYKTN